MSWYATPVWAVISHLAMGVSMHLIRAHGVHAADQFRIETRCSQCMKPSGRITCKMIIIGPATLLARVLRSQH
jgi:hypothetical protein